MSQHQSDADRLIESAKKGNINAAITEAVGTKSTARVQEEYTPDQEYSKAVAIMGKIKDATDALQSAIAGAGSYDQLVASKEKIKTCLAELDEQVCKLNAMRWDGAIHFRNV